MPWNHWQPRPSVDYRNAAPGRPPTDSVPGPTCVASTGPSSETNSGWVPNSSARRSASRCASSCAYACWTNHRSAPTARRCRISSTNRSTARLRVRTRSTALNSDSTIKIGLRSSADPSHAAAPPIRPPRRRYSRVSRRNHCSDLLARPARRLDHPRGVFPRGGRPRRRQRLNTQVAGPRRPSRSPPPARHRGPQTPAVRLPARAIEQVSENGLMRSAPRQRRCAAAAAVQRLTTKSSTVGGDCRRDALRRVQFRIEPSEITVELRLAQPAAGHLVAAFRRRAAINVVIQRHNRDVEAVDQRTPAGRRCCR